MGKTDEPIITTTVRDRVGIEAVGAEGAAPKSDRAGSEGWKGVGETQHGEGRQSGEGRGVSGRGGAERHRLLQAGKERPADGARI